MTMLVLTLGLLLSTAAPLQIDANGFAVAPVSLDGRPAITWIVDTAAGSSAVERSSARVCHIRRSSQARERSPIMSR